MYERPVCHREVPAKYPAFSPAGFFPLAGFFLGRTVVWIEALAGRRQGFPVQYGRS